MPRSCGNCRHYGARVTTGGRGRYSYNRCLLTGGRVNYLMTGCQLHLSNQDIVVKQQAQDEKWRSGASVPLAVPE